jgi:hypothetical protein
MRAVLPAASGRANCGDSLGGKRRAPGNVPWQVLARVPDGKEHRNELAGYRSAQRAISRELPETFAARTDAQKGDGSRMRRAPRSTTPAG